MLCRDAIVVDNLSHKGALLLVDRNRGLRTVIAVSGQVQSSVFSIFYP